MDLATACIEDVDVEQWFPLDGAVPVVVVDLLPKAMKAAEMESRWLTGG